MSPSLRPWPRAGRVPRWLVLLVLAAAFLLAAAGAWAGACWWTSTHLQAAREALARQRPELARRHLKRCLQVWPGSVEVRLLAAQAARRLDLDEEAEWHLTACEQRQGVTAATALEWSLLRAQRGELADVEGPLRDMVQHDHADSLLILEALAKGYRNTFRPEDVVDALDLLLQRQPDHLIGLRLRGQALEGLDVHDEARRDFQRAVDLDPDSVDTRLSLADCLARLGHTREAVAHYEYLRQRPPGSPEPILGLARCRHDLHELDEARRLIEDLLAERPDCVPALVEGGRLALQSGQVQQAEERLQRAVALAPFDRDAWLVLHRCLEAQGKEEEDRRCQARLAAIEEDLMRLTTLRAQVLDTPQDAGLRCEIGMLLLRTGREPEGLRWLKSALQCDPNHRPARAALAEYERQAPR